MPRSRSRSKSQGRVDPVRRACQLRRFHRDLQAKHPYKKDLIARFDTDTLAAIDLLIGDGTDWQVVLDGETEHDPNWMKKPQSLPSAIVWIKRWAKDAADGQEHVDGGDGPVQAATPDDVDSANLEGPSGSEREQAAATDAVGTANFDGPAGSSVNPVPPLWNLQAGDKARNTFEEGLKVLTAGPLDTRPSNAGPSNTETLVPKPLFSKPLDTRPSSAGPLVSRPLDTAVGKSNRTEPRAIRYQNAQTYPSLPIDSRPSIEQPRSSFRLPTNARESFGSQEVVDAIARYTSSSATSLSTAVHKETDAEALERREKDLARKREENAVATAAYDEIPQPYLDWLMAYKDASRRQRAMEEAEELCEAVQARVKLERDALDVATRELEGAKRAVTNAKQQRFELAMGRGSGHEGVVLSRDAGAADDDAPLHALRSHRKQRAEAYNTALERCTTAAKEHAAAYDDWTTARDAYQEAEVLEAQRKRAWEQLRSVRRGDVGR
ncbi:hypothetical protein CGLO_12839 [Colletotrichum gloeosporioides Cg-14]|uniref:Uncharacterized protein n=1 Tax=Colletotrichum gloeosporioides (strain Cg-14) TaxID=1237896 RepID=T0L8P1_COLGC|nr:hypothetical protein CGLO_12839 [Colletotrichum gloeosporioides Cg-14]